MVYNVYDTTLKLAYVKCPDTSFEKRFRFPFRIFPRTRQPLSVTAQVHPKLRQGSFQLSLVKTAFLHHPKMYIHACIIMYIHTTIIVVRTSPMYAYIIIIVITLLG